MRLNPNRRAGGNAHCNIWHGTYRLGAGTINFREIGSTRRYCPEPLMSQENHYLRISRVSRTHERLLRFYAQHGLPETRLPTLE